MRTVCCLVVRPDTESTALRNAQDVSPGGRFQSRRDRGTQAVPPDASTAFATAVVSSRSTEAWLTKEIGFLFLLPRCRIDQPHRFRIASVLAIRDHSTKSARVSQKVTSPPAARADGELSVSAQVRHTSTWPRDGSSGCDQLRRQRPEGSNKQSGNGNGTPNSPWYRGPCSSPFEYCSACTSAPSPMTWATPLRHESIFNAPEGYTDPGTATHSRSRAALDPIILVGCPYPSKSCSTGERISPLFWFTSRGTTRDAQRERTS